MQPSNVSHVLDLDVSGKQLRPRASPVFHPSRGHPSIWRRQPLGMLGDRWSSLTCEGAAKPPPSVTGIDLNVFSLQRTWCARCSIGPWLHWSMVDPPWTGIFSKNNQQVWQITGGPLSEPRWLVNKVKLQKEHWTFLKKIYYFKSLVEEELFFFRKFCENLYSFLSFFFYISSTLHKGKK